MFVYKDATYTLVWVLTSFLNGCSVKTCNNFVQKMPTLHSSLVASYGQNMDNTTVVFFAALRRTFRPRAGKSLYFLKKAPNLQETETPAKEIPYTPGNGNPQKSFLYFRKWNFSVHPKKISYTSGNENPEKISYFFSKEGCSYASGKGNPKNLLFQQTSYIFQKAELSYNFRKRNLFIFRERNIQNPSIFRTRSIFRRTSTMERFAKIATWHTFLYSRK